MARPPGAASVRKAIPSGAAASAPGKSARAARAMRGGGGGVGVSKLVFQDLCSRGNTNKFFVAFVTQKDKNSRYVCLHW